ncbi:MAG: NfeD family protein [Actinomycetota bacterium]
MALLSLAGGPLSPAGAQTSGDELPDCPQDLNDLPAGDTTIRIVKVSGLIDPVVHSYLLRELDQAEEANLLGLVIWMNSNGSVVDEADFAELGERLADSPVTIAIWVGQAGATARGGAAELLGVADIVGVSTGSTIGQTGPARLPAELGPAFGEATERLETSTIGAEEAIRLGISEGPLADTSAIGSFVTRIPGYETFPCYDAAAVVDADDDEAATAGEVPPAGLRTLPLTRNEITGLPISSQLFHTVASPEVAYLFFAMGLALLIFELYTAGIGIAGVIGAGFLALGAYGLAVLPARWWAIALLLLALVAMAVDVQTNVPRLYTALGVAAFVIGTLLLYDGVSMSWVTIAVGIIGAILYAYIGMPNMVRTRFSTPTIGRKWMIGEMGEAITDVSPEGTVRIRDVAWKAMTNRATPVRAGDPIRVVAIDRLVLEIEPEEGGAKDYRDRRSRSDQQGS